MKGLTQYNQSNIARDENSAPKSSFPVLNFPLLTPGHRTWRRCTGSIADDGYDYSGYDDAKSDKYDGIRKDEIGDGNKAEAAAVDQGIDKFIRRTLTNWECGGCQKAFKNRVALRNHVEANETHFHLSVGANKT